MIAALLLSCRRGGGADPATLADLRLFISHELPNISHNVWIFTACALAMNLEYRCTFLLLIRPEATACRRFETRRTEGLGRPHLGDKKSPRRCPRRSTSSIMLAIASVFLLGPHPVALAAPRPLSICCCRHSAGEQRLMLVACRSRRWQVTTLACQYRSSNPASLPPARVRRQRKSDIRHQESLDTGSCTRTEDGFPAFWAGMQERRGHLTRHALNDTPVWMTHQCLKHDRPLMKHAPTRSRGKISNCSFKDAFALGGLSWR